MRKRHRTRKTAEMREKTKRKKTKRKKTKRRAPIEERTQSRSEKAACRRRGRRRFFFNGGTWSGARPSKG